MCWIRRRNGFKRGRTGQRNRGRQDLFLSGKLPVFGMQNLALHIETSEPKRNGSPTASASGEIYVDNGIYVYQIKQP